MEMPLAPTLFADAARQLGYHPFPAPSANMSQACTNPLGVQLGPCTYCGYCDRFGCGNYSKASPQTTILPVLMRKPNFTLRTESEVLKVDLDPSGKRATGVTFVDTQGRTWEQPAELVILTAYALHNVHLLLVSGVGQVYDPATGQGTMGKNYAYQIVTGVDLFFDDKILNPFIGAGALGVAIDDFNGDNFDHGGKGFIGGGYLATWQTGARPIETPRGRCSRATRSVRRRGRYSSVPYQTTHNTGGAIMGEDPKTSVVNRYLQSWDVPNLFVMGACAFPQNPGYNPTGTVGALAYNARTVAYGPMAEVVESSTSQLTDDDLRAIATYLKDVPPSEAPQAAGEAPERQVMSAGEAIYLDQCAACHRTSGEGMAGMLPALKGGSVTQSADPTSRER